jgi:hypothetical protein
MRPCDGIFVITPRRGTFHGDHRKRELASNALYAQLRDGQPELTPIRSAPPGTGRPIGMRSERPVSMSTKPRGALPPPAGMTAPAGGPPTDGTPRAPGLRTLNPRSGFRRRAAILGLKSPSPGLPRSLLFDEACAAFRPMRRSQQAADRTSVQARRTTNPERHSARRTLTRHATRATSRPAPISALDSGPIPRGTGGPWLRSGPAEDRPRRLCLTPRDTRTLPRHFPRPAGKGSVSRWRPSLPFPRTRRFRLSRAWRPRRGRGAPRAPRPQPRSPYR